MTEDNPKRRPGRPKGATTAVVRDVRLGLHQFAFLRATIQGMELRAAWKRFMAFTEYSVQDADADLRLVAKQRQQLLELVISKAESADAALPESVRLTSHISVLRGLLKPSAAASPARSLTITFEEWWEKQGYDEDFISLEAAYREYQEELHLDRALEPEEEQAQARAPDRISIEVSALNAVSAHIAQAPSSLDDLAQWLHPTVARRLGSAGLHTVGDLASHINLHGYRWYRRVRGLGEKSAEAIGRWLADSAEHLREPVWARSLVPPGRLDSDPGRDLIPLPRFGIVPLDMLAIPPWLDGSKGTFRTGMPNTLGASNDLEAIRAWLSKHQEHRHTFRSYTKEAERFYLWCLHEAKVPLSSVTSPMCQDYRRFLGALPEGWIQPPTARRANDDRWRPFRKQLSPASIKQAIVIIQSMFAGLQEAGYLVANPMSAVSKGFALPSSSIDVHRSLTNAEWDHVQSYLESHVEGAARRRMRALLSLLVGTGLRLEELARASWGDLSRVDVDGEDAWMLKVIGKRNKAREVAVPTETIRLLEDHRMDFRTDDRLDPSEPLIGRIGAAIYEGESTGRPALPSPLEALGQLGAVMRMSAGGIYMVLRRFFRAAAAAAPPHIDQEHLHRASTHWLRHTFGRQGAQAGIPVEVLQQALGHSSLTTTGIYLSTERDRMVREMRKLSVR